MEINITSDTFSENKVAIQLVDKIEDEQEKLLLEKSILYYEFPIFKEINQELKYPSFTIVDANYGVILIQCDDRGNRSLEENEIYNILEDIDDLSNFLYSKFLKVSGLRKKRGRNEISFPINIIVYMPNYNGETKIDEYEFISVVNSFKKLHESILEYKIDTPLTESALREIISVIDGSRGLPKPKDRNITDETRSTKGALLEELESELSIFDEKQKIAALTQIEGPQRIRGLAGSGKTVVLAMKAALIHLKNPDAKILYTFYTKSLYDHIRGLITRFYRMHEDHDPNWNKISILHAWGGKSLPGVYFETCNSNRIIPLKLDEAKRGNPRDPFGFICEDLLYKTNGNLNKTYDYVLLDEGQDFSPPFYWLLRKIVKNDCLVWAYDELQNILNVNIQETEQIFKNKYGDEGISLSKLQEEHPRQNNDIVLYKCYRNPREILVISHAIGFGIYNNKVLQRLENKDHWIDLGYDVLKGNCIEGEDTIICRPEQNSPSTISDKFNIDEIIKTKIFNGYIEEINWVCKSIEDDLNQNLLPEDIMIISYDDRYARKYFQSIEKILFDKDIRVNNILESYTGDDFIVNGAVTLTTVYRAKGNEAAVVYVIGVEQIYNQGMDDITERNKLFTAFTRAKAWLRVTGASDEIEDLVMEINEAKSHYPKLEFVYPGIQQIKTLRRELASANQLKNKKMRELQEKIEDLGLTPDEVITMLKGGKNKNE